VNRFSPGVGFDDLENILIGAGVDVPTRPIDGTRVLNWGDEMIHQALHKLAEQSWQFGRSTCRISSTRPVSSVRPDWGPPCVGA